MLKGEKFDAFALLKQTSFDLCFLSNLSMLSIKDKFAFSQIQLCLLTNEKIFQISFEI